jgi:hypothetical protein
MIAAGCSSSQPLSIDIARPDAPGDVPATISGPAVDEGVVCADGTVFGYHLEDMNGNTLGFNEWGANVDAAMQAGTVVEAQNHVDIECNDGSGTITVIEHIRFDFAVIDFPGQEGWKGTWTLEGTGDYENLSGSGEYYDDPDSAMIHDAGEVES